ncbi:MAG: Ribosomal protein S12 methylthiotransferase RimO [Firmicutes bacterium]|nr:Ribosomal protein S12 methylthiotransferase RimO [Bacillota bacterium]MBT9157071.1 Ribosomal protein S12 methylthiotransferase RimO [Bacillota bacterium]
MHIGIVTLGCTKNQVDSELMQGLLKAEGNKIVPDLEEADIVLVNTCGFIQAAKEESIAAILSAAQYKSGRCQKLLVAGCLSQRYAEQLMTDIPEIDGMVGTGSFTSICSVLQQVMLGERVLAVGEASYDYEEFIERDSSVSYSTYIKIAEGCSNWCSYCAIPLVRGEYRSRTIESILRESRHLADKGAREINLIAQDTTRYGLDLYGRPRLVDLLEKLQTIAGIEWIRLLYCYPDFITQELIEALASFSKVCQYMDLPLQHISPRILKAMNRRGTKDEIISLLVRLRERMPRITLRTTFIVGFPGETDEEFRELADFIKEVEFDHVGVFKYSREEDTAADSLPDQVSEKVKEVRFRELMTIQQQISRKKNQKAIGSVVQVLVEGPWIEGDGIVGRARKDAPEVDGKVYVTGAQVAIGQLVKVLVQEASEYDLFGVLASEFSQ